MLVRRAHLHTRQRGHCLRRLTSVAAHPAVREAYCGSLLGTTADDFVLCQPWPLGGYLNDSSIATIQWTPQVFAMQAYYHHADEGPWRDDYDVLQPMCEARTEYTRQNWK